MRSLPALALLGCCAVLQGHAQRVGGFRGGGAGHASGGFHGEFGGGARGSFGSRSSSFALRGNGPGVYRPSYRTNGSRSFPGPYTSRSSFAGVYGRFRGAYTYGPAHYPVRRPYSFPRGYYPNSRYSGTVGFGYLTPFWDFADNLGYDQPPYDAQSASPEGASVTPYQPQSGNPYAPYAAQEPSLYAAQAPDAYQTSPAQPYAAAPYSGSQPMVYAPAPYAYGQPPSPQVTVITLPPPPREEDAVTIFYRDGRPPEQIRNYALTRSALLLTGERIREIPLQDIDLPLTERVNRAAGVEFRLPVPN